MLVGSRKKAKDSLNALQSAFEGNFYNRHLTGQESLQNIHDNIIGITLQGNPEIKQPPYRHYGLLLTTDGYILTSYRHFGLIKQRWDQLRPNSILQRLFYERKVRDIYYAHVHDTKFPLDVRICAALPQYDMAIVKAMLPEKAEPIKFHIEIHEPNIDDKLRILGDKQQTELKKIREEIKPGNNTQAKRCIELYDGTVTKGQNAIVNVNNSNIEDIFTMQTKYHRESGGEPIVTAEGKLVGMVLGATHHNSHKEAFCAKIRRMQACVDKARKQLQEEIGL